MTNPEAPQPKVGDVVNSHRLTQQPDGSLTWVLLSPEEAAAAAVKPAKKWYTRKAILIPGIIVLAFILIAAIGSGNRRGDNTAAVDKDDVSSEIEEPAVEEEPAVDVAVPDVVGKSAILAIAALEDAGFTVPQVTDIGATVVSTDPAAGEMLPEGSTVTLTIQEKPKLTLAQENALQSARSYIALAGFSRTKLINQLNSEYGEGYPLDVATWAADAVGADWTAEATEAAQSYLEIGGFSRDRLYEQLTSAYGEAFTPDEANAALAAVGY